MRKYVTTLFLICVLITASAQPNDEEQIKETIDRESRFYGEGNYEGWASFWVRGPETMFVYADSKGHAKLQGWDAISAAIRSSISNRSQSGLLPDTAYLERDDFHFTIDGNMALVSFRQRDNFAGPQEKNEARVMKKVDGQWKILSIMMVRTSSYKKD